MKVMEGEEKDMAAEMAIMDLETLSGDNAKDIKAIDEMVSMNMMSIGANMMSIMMTSDMVAENMMSIGANSDAIMTVMDSLGVLAF